MKKTANKTRAKKYTPAKRSAAKSTKPAAASDGKLSFNHAMIYAKDVARALTFYRDLLGFKLIEDFRYEGKSVYARLRAPGNEGTIALHQAGPNDSVASDGVRLYFEIEALDDFCRKLQQKGFYITKMPQMMPWGWRHAYLNDPDGHEISLYWAGAKRMKKSVMDVARKAANA
jgi:catechol 2,3-dioxygenase-like lactoylglutathione lyase family enzyme